MSCPRFSPLIVILVPGGPSLGDTPVTSGAPPLGMLNLKSSCSWLGFS